MTEDRQAGFEEFVRGQSTSLLRVAYLLTGDVHAGEDLLQGVLEKMYLRWHRIRLDPVAYARRALVNASTNRWRGHRRRPEAPLRADHDVGRPDESGAVVERDRTAAALRTLPARQRAVVVLRYLEDLSEAQTATLLDISVGTVKSQAARGLARLRTVLAEDPEPTPERTHMPTAPRRPS